MGLSLGPHAIFILAAYAAAALVVALLLGWIWVEYRHLRGALAELERSHPSRRPEPSS
jgi:heme exporter protein D